MLKELAAMIHYDVLETPQGKVYIALDQVGVCKVAITDQDWQEYKEEISGLTRGGARSSLALRQLEEYLLGTRQEFTLPLSIQGTDFFRLVWQALCAIPYGEVRTYTEIAVKVGRPKACRSIGLANYNNPVPIFIPCHRVIGKNGTLVGYKGANTEFKRYLLQIEKNFNKLQIY